LGDVESERDSYREKLSDYDSIRQRLAEVEERESLLIKNIEDLNVKNNFAQVCKMKYGNSVKLHSK
jgi:hypothetical protein